MKKRGGKVGAGLRLFGPVPHQKIFCVVEAVSALAAGHCRYTRNGVASLRRFLEQGQRKRRRHEGTFR